MTLYSPESREVNLPKTFQHSVLPPEIQLGFVAEIQTKISAALLEDAVSKRDTPVAWFSIFDLGKKPSPNIFYVATAVLYPKGVNNIPFAITRDPAKFRLNEAHTVGPFPATLACAVSYLSQEASVLVAQKYNREVAEILHLRSVVGYGQGIAQLEGQLGAWSSKDSKFSMEELIQRVVTHNRKGLEKEVNDYKKRYENGRVSFGYDENSSAHFEWKEAEDRFKGFEEGVLLLQELLQFQ